MRLVDRHPQLDAPALVSRFRPPPRFRDVSFDNYHPDPAHPSQAAALAELRRFADRMPASAPRWFRRGRDRSPAGRYLDGGFGVGKTHLLASLWHAAPEPKAYCTFSELTAFVGFAGMRAATEALGHYKLLCIDEFELDDVANTLMVVSLLRGVMPNAIRLAVTSNTLPDRLGEKRFSAAEFKREIAAIASHFTEIRIDGDDYRSHSPRLPPADLASRPPEKVTHDEFDSVMGHLRRVHPVHYGAMVDDVEGVVIEGMHPIPHQDGALLWVQFVDKLYDARIPVRVTGCDVASLFSASYRNGGYAKKYGRAESRLAAMQLESAGAL